MTRFRLYSTDIAPTTTPDVASPAATLNIKWDHDPLKPGSLEITEPEGRGAVIPTGAGGTVIHDLGVPEGGGTITVSGDVTSGQYLLPAAVAAFRAAYRAVGTQYYLTDGYRVWRVVWSRKPAGFSSWMHQRWAEAGRVEYSYKFVFVIVREELT